MPTTDELLEQMEAEALSTSADDCFIVDNDLRTITVPGSITVLGVEHDDDVHRLYFQLPKMYGEFDLSEFDIRINYVNADGKGDFYPVDDKEASGDNITFSWLVGRTAFEKMGDVIFNVCLRKMDNDGVVIKEFNTTIATLPPVLEGLETTELIVQQNPDIIESILQRLGVLEENGSGGGTSNYPDLTNKPTINGVELSGDKTAADLGLQKADFIVNMSIAEAEPEQEQEEISTRGQVIKPNYTVDKTFEEIVSAIDEGKKVYVRFYDIDITLASIDNDYVRFIYSDTFRFDNFIISIYSDNTVHVGSQPSNIATDFNPGIVYAEEVTEDDTTPVHIDEYGFLAVSAKPKDFITTLTYSEGTYTADHTLTEIEFAYNRGCDCFCVFDSIKMELTSLTSDTSVTFQNNNLGTINTVTIQSDGTVARNTTKLTPTETSLGMVLAEEKTDADTIPVTADSNGFLWTKLPKFTFNVTTSFTDDSANLPTLSADKTYAEIRAAYNSGMFIECKLAMSSSDASLLVEENAPTFSNNIIGFLSLAAIDDNYIVFFSPINNYRISIDNTNTWLIF